MNFEEFLTGPDTPGGRYLRRFWQPVLRASDIAPGDAKPIRIMSENYTLYRGETGTLHLADHACAHRGTRLSTGFVEGDCIRCLYRGWMYDASGQCIEQPGEPAEFSAKIRIKTYPVAEYLGLVFGYFGEESAPPLRRFPELEGPGVLEIDPPEAWPCHFLNRLDNDMAHVPWTHRESLKRVGQTVGHNTYAQTYEETAFGVADPNGVGNPHVMPNINVLRVPVRGNAQFEGKFLNRLIFVVPNDDDNSTAFDLTFLAGVTGDDAEAFRRWRRPRLDESSDAESALDIARDILAGKRSVRDVPASLSREKQFWIEDYVTQVGQGRLIDRVPEHLGRNDALVIQFRKLWRREVRAMLAGQPLTDWTSSGFWDYQVLRPGARVPVASSSGD